MSLCHKPLCFVSSNSGLSSFGLKTNLCFFITSYLSIDERFLDPSPELMFQFLISVPCNYATLIKDLF